MSATEKSIADRLANIEKTVKAVEKFYRNPMYKAISENASPESTMKKSIKEQIADGQVRFTQ
jgi:hypothetical protein